jgi:hypothetical protein
MSKNIKFRTFKPRDLVYLYTPALGKDVSKKLSKVWTGPHIVVERLNNANFRIKLKGGRTQIVHISRLKLFPPGKDVMTGKIRHPEWEEESNVSETSTILPTFSEEDDYEADGGSGRREAGDRSLEWDDGKSSDESIWSEEDWIPLAKLGVRQPRRDAEDSASAWKVPVPVSSKV